jgi:hypothetical protein
LEQQNDSLLSKTLVLWGMIPVLRKKETKPLKSSPDYS